MALVSLQNISQLIGIGREQSQIHHALRQRLLMLICIYIRYGRQHTIHLHKARIRKGETRTSWSLSGVIRLGIFRTGRHHYATIIWRYQAIVHAMIGI